MLTRRGVFGFLFGSAAVPAILTPPRPGGDPDGAQAGINLVWDSRAGNWVVENQWVMTSKGDEVLFQGYDGKGKQIRHHRYPVRRYGSRPQDPKWG